MKFQFEIANTFHNDDHARIYSCVLMCLAFKEGCNKQHLHEQG